MGKRRIYEWMLHYRNVAERKRFRITRFKLTKAQARQLADECQLTMNLHADMLYERLLSGDCNRMLNIPVIVV